MCSGKWKKTRSGRKQKFVVQLGRIPNSGVSNLVFFDQMTQKTKFGCFSVKVWIFMK
jgi:ribosomal protein S3